MDIKRDFAEYLYNRLPKIYRTSDKDQILEKFIETFVEGGFNTVINDMINLPDLLDVDKCPKKFLPLLSRSYGYEYSEELPELFQRRLLKNIVEMYKRKGTKSVVKFIARELSGFETEIIENKDFTENEIEISGWDIRFEHYRNFILKLNAPYETSMLNAKEDAVRLIVKDFLPTNSNVLVVTSYWFEESDDFSHNRIVEDTVFETLKEYNEEINSINNYLETAMKDSLKIKEDIEKFALTKDPVILDKIKEQVVKLNYSLKDVSYSDNQKIKESTVYTFDTKNGISETDKCGILMIETKESYDNVRMREDNSLLNNTACVLGSFLTNGLLNYDIVREQGKEDQIILI